MQAGRMREELKMKEDSQRVNVKSEKSSPSGGNSGLTPLITLPYPDAHLGGGDHNPQLQQQHNPFDHQNPIEQQINKGYLQ